MAITNNAANKVKNVPGLETLLMQMGGPKAGPTSRVLPQSIVPQQAATQGQTAARAIQSSIPEVAGLSNVQRGAGLAQSIPTQLVQSGPTAAPVSSLGSDLTANLRSSSVAGNMAGPASQFPQVQQTMGSRLAAMKSGLTKPTTGSIMKGGGAAIAGQLASGFVDSMDIGGENSNIDQGLSGALAGAGLGAGAALAFGGPVGWAALGGAAAFGIGKAVFGDNETQAEKMQGRLNGFNEIMGQLSGGLNIRPDVLEETMLPLNLQIQMAMETGDKAALEAAVASAEANLPAILQQAAAQSGAKDSEEDRYNRMIANQAQFAPIFDKAMDRANLSQQEAMRHSSDIASKLRETSPGLADMVQTTAARSGASQDALMAAYAGQLALAPQVTADQNLLQERVMQQELLAQQMGAMV